MTNLEFLQSGKVFPPLEEAKRIGSYVDLDLMYDGDTFACEERHFKETVNNLNSLALKCGWGSSIGVEYNYFQLNSKKTADFACGETPEIKVSTKADGMSDEAKRSRNNKLQETVEEIRSKTNFDKKCWDTFLDVSKYGNTYLRVYRKADGANTFTVVNPSMVIKVVNPEDRYEVDNYVVAWVEGNILHAQVHYKGYYERIDFETESCVDTASVEVVNSYRYAIETERFTQKRRSYVLVHDLHTAEYFRWVPWKIGRQLNAPQRVETGLEGFAIFEIENARNSEGVYGTSDYDSIDSIIAACHRIIGEVMLIFDRYTLPSAYGDPSYLEIDKTGERVFRLGSFFPTPGDGHTPGFLQPDMSQLQYYYEMLRHFDTKIREFSEMGAVYGVDSEAASGISTETMKARFISAISKAARLTNRNTQAFKELIHAVSLYGYEDVIETDDLEITWFDGLPNDDEADERIVTARLANNTTSRKREMVERQGLSIERAEQILDEKLEEDSDFQTIMASNWLTPEDGDEIDEDEEDKEGGGKEPVSGKRSKGGQEVVKNKETAETGE